MARMPQTSILFHLDWKRFNRTGECVLVDSDSFIYTAPEKEISSIIQIFKSAGNIYRRSHRSNEIGKYYFSTNAKVDAKVVTGDLIDVTGILTPVLQIYSERYDNGLIGTPTSVMTLKQKTHYIRTAVINIDDRGVHEGARKEVTLGGSRPQLRINIPFRERKTPSPRTAGAVSPSLSPHSAQPAKHSPQAKPTLDAIDETKVIQTTTPPQLTGVSNSSPPSMAPFLTRGKEIMVVKREFVYVIQKGLALSKIKLESSSQTPLFLPRDVAIRLARLYFTSGDSQCTVNVGKNEPQYEAGIVLANDETIESPQRDLYNLAVYAQDKLRGELNYLDAKIKRTANGELAALQKEIECVRENMESVNRALFNGAIPRAGFYNFLEFMLEKPIAKLSHERQQQILAETNGIKDI